MGRANARLADRVTLSDMALREGEDYYFEGPYMVFTAAYHLRRGSCCQSGCRHCPWEYQKPSQDSNPVQEVSSHSEKE